MLTKETVVVRSDEKIGLEVVAQASFNDDEIGKLWWIVDNAFAELSENSSNDQAPSEEEFTLELFSDSVINLILRRRGVQTPLGYMGIHTTTNHLMWVKSNLIEKYFKKPEDRGSFFYNSALAIEPDTRSLGAGIFFLRSGIRHVYEIAKSVGSAPTVGFDYCSDNDPGIPLLMQMAIRKEGLPLKISTILRVDSFGFKVSPNPGLSETNTLSDLAHKDYQKYSIIQGG